MAEEDAEDIMEIAEEIFFDLAMVDGAGEGASYLTREELVEATGGNGELFDELFRRLFRRNCRPVLCDVYGELPL